VKKVVFAYDYRFVFSGVDVFSGGAFGADFWERYLTHFSEVTVVARSASVNDAAHATALTKSSRNGVSCRFFPNLSTPSAVLRLPALKREMMVLLAAHDCVIGRLPSEIGLLAANAARRLGRPYALEVVGCAWDGLRNHGSVAARLYAPIATARIKRPVAGAEHVLYVTETFLQQRYPTRARNTCSASNVVIAAAPYELLQSRYRRIATIPDRTLHLGLIGSLYTRYKGIQILLAALARSHRALPPLRLHILGAGDAKPWRAEAERLGVGNMVDFEGALPAGEPVLRWLDDIDVYLQPSLQEGLPRVLIEAMSRGCPAIASSSAGIPELLPRDDLVHPGDIDGLAALLRHRLHDQNWMIDRVYRNWRESHKYTHTELDIRRQLFYKKFAESSLSNNSEYTR